MSTALSLGYEAQQHRLKAKFEQGQRNKRARQDARKAAENLDVQNSSDDLLDMYLPLDQDEAKERGMRYRPSQRAHTRLLVVVDPVAEGVDVGGHKKGCKLARAREIVTGICPDCRLPMRPSRAPAMSQPDPLIGYHREVMALVKGNDGSATLEPATGARGEETVTVWTSLERPAVEARAALRALVQDRLEFGPTEAWSVYGRWQGERVDMLVVGKLSFLRYYWPDAMTRKRLKAAGVDVDELGMPLQIRKHNGPTVTTPSNESRR